MNRITSKNGYIDVPCLDIKIVPIGKIRANNYNPNAVPENNMRLLKKSIMENGFCFPVVTIWDEADDCYVIVDGFHRYTVMKDYMGAKSLPVVVLKHDISQRMAATVQFNRARGVHQVELLGDLVKSLSDQGLTDLEISKQLGMEDEEVFRLKQITGIAELFKNQEYSLAWEMEEVPDDKMGI